MTAPFIDNSKWGILYPDRATLQSEIAGARDALGHAVITWQNVPGLVNLPCNVAVQIRGSNETQGIDGAIATSTHEITFQTFHAGITEKMRCVIGGVTYNILLADSDPMKVSSILKARKVIG